MSQLDQQNKDLIEEIKANKKYLREQEQLIKDTIDLGNNHIAQLTRQADELTLAIQAGERELVVLATKIDNRRFELLMLN